MLTRLTGAAMGIYSVVILVLATNMYRINMWAAHFDMVNHTERGLHVYNFCKLLVAEWPANMLILSVMLLVMFLHEKKEKVTIG